MKGFLIIVAGGFLGLTPAAAQPLDFGALVGKWVWAQAATCATYLHTLQALAGIPVKPRATRAAGKLKVALRVGQLTYDLE